MPFTILDSLDSVTPWGQSARVTTTANITLSGTQTIDGISVAVGDLVLVKNQTTGSQNGLYLCQSGAWTRYFGANADGDFTGGQIVYVREGTAAGKSTWALTTVGAITLGTTSLTYQRLNRAGQATAGTYGSASQVPVAALNDDGTVSSFTNTSIAIGPTQVTGLTNNQVLFGSSGTIGQSSNLQFNGTNLGVGGSPSVAIHAVGGQVRADGYLYTRGSGNPVSTSTGSSIRLQNTVANAFFYLSHYDDGYLKLANDGGTPVLLADQNALVNIGGTATVASAVLSLDSTTTGFLPPRMTTTQRNLITSPATGLLLYNTTTDALTVRTSTGWVELGSGGGLTGSGTGAQVAFWTSATNLSGSANMGWDNSNIILYIGNPASGTGRILVKGSTTNNTGYAWQGFNSSDVETSRISNDGYYQGNGLAKVGLSLTGDFGILATLDQTFSLTHTTGTRAGYGMKVGFSPTSGTGVFYGLDIRPTINQTGGASGATAAAVFGGTITAAADFAAVRIVNTAQKGLWQDSTSVINLLGGDTGFGTQTSPQYILDIGDTGAIRLPVGTTAQQPTTAQGLLRFNSSTPGLEYHDGTAWRTILNTAVGLVGSGSANQIAYFSSASNLTSNANGGFDGTNMGLGVASTANQRLTIVGAGNTSGTYGLVIHNSGGTNNQFVVRNDGRVGILQSAPIYPLHVEGAAVFGTAGANTTNSPRTFNLYDANAVVRVWRKTNTTNAGPAVELVWGPVTGGNDTSTNAANRYWDFYISGSADQFGIRKRTGGTDVVGLLIQPEMDIQHGPDTVNSIKGGTAYSQASSRNSVAGDRQISRFAMSTNSNTNTSFDLFLNGSSTYPDIDNSPATSKVWGCNISLTILVTARTSGTPLVGDSMTFNYVGHIKKIAGTYSNSTFTQVAVSGDANLNATTVSITVNVSGQLLITVTRPAGTATYAAVATVQTQEIAY